MPTVPRSLKSSTPSPAWSPRRPRLVGVQDHHRHALATPEGLVAREGGVALEVAGRRQQAQRPALPERRLLGVLVPVGHRRQPLGREVLRVELELSRRRPESLAVRIGIDLDRPGRPERAGIDARRGPGRARRTPSRTSSSVAIENTASRTPSRRASSWASRTLDHASPCAGTACGANCT